MEKINVMIMCDKEADIHKENSSEYDNKGGENTLRTSKKKEKACDCFVIIYECGKHLFYSTYE